MRITKKTIILLFVAVAFFITAASPIYAGKESPLFPSWFTNAIKPIQNSINSLFQRTDNHEARIAELEKKVNFDLPRQWGVSFYEDRFIMNTPNDNSPSTISLPNIPSDYNCTWNNAVIDLSTSVRAIAHLSTGDIFGVGTCREILFKVNDIPPSGTTFEADIYVFWQGTEKHAKQSITVPNRPFPTWNSSLLISPSGNGVFTIQGTGALGIGTTSATQQLIIDCGIYNCSDLWKINN